MGKFNNPLKTIVTVKDIKSSQTKKEKDINNIIELTKKRLRKGK